MPNNIFEVDVKGLRQLQEGKPKWHVIRELLQNAMDEEITRCNIYLKFEYGKAHITVEDDSPIGFRDLSDAYTLFKETYKRSDVKKRGQFNFGEKQVLCLSDYARIITTTGGLEFNVMKGERKTLRRKREKGSEVYVVVKMTKQEFNECVEHCNAILVPDNIRMILTVNDGEEKTLFPTAPFKAFTAKLPTIVKVEDVMKRVSRDTEVHLHKTGGTAYIFEMGIPICEIDCDYSIDVQQKVPMSNDRDKVEAKYLKAVFGEVLNVVKEDITTENASNLWVRDGFTSDRANSDVQKHIITQRFGEKALIANPNDKRSVDEAISGNYNVVYGSEMSKEEWAVVKENSILVSTSSQFKTGVADGKLIKPNDVQLKLAAFCKKIAREFMNISLNVSFLESPDASVIADFNPESDHLRFNVSHINDIQWHPYLNGKGLAVVQQPMLDLIIHELGHKRGWHYEHSYHECITMLGSKLTIKALEDPNWFVL